MGCPHRSTEGSSEEIDPSRFLERRSFLRSALAIGGVSALSACLENQEQQRIPPGAPRQLPRRQHAWNDYLPRDGHDNTTLPTHQLILLLNYAGSGEPTEADRQAVEAAMSSVDEAYLWGMGGTNPYHYSDVDGLFTMLAYSASYFDRFDQSLPDGTGLKSSDDVVRALDEPSESAGDYDAMLLLSSDHVSVLLSVEQSLFGNVDHVNELFDSDTFTMDDTLEGVFEVAKRRSGFISAGEPHHRIDERIPEDAPLSMGFRSGFQQNQATEDAVTITDGPFSGGTTLHHSRLQLDLDSWYDDDMAARRERMFSPEHTREDVGEVGERLADDSLMSESVVDAVEEHAVERGRVGHTQKSAAARNSDFEPKILRRSESVANNSLQPGFNFISLQRDIEDIIDVRRAMNGEHFDNSEVPEEEDGILGHIDVVERATFLVPPREHRALPRPQPK